MYVLDEQIANHELTTSHGETPIDVAGIIAPGSIPDCGWVKFDGHEDSLILTDRPRKDHNAGELN